MGGAPTEIRDTTQAAFNDLSSNKDNTSTHDNIAAATAAGVAAAQGSEGTPTVARPQAEKAAAAKAGTAMPNAPKAEEQSAVDAHYKRGDAPQELVEGQPDPDAYKAEADRVYGK